MAMKNILIVAAAACCWFSSAVIAQEDLCSVAAIQAFKTKYESHTYDDIGVELYQSVCSSSDSKKGFNLGYSDDTYKFSFGKDSKTVASACDQRDYRYFREFQNEILTTFLPKEAFNIFSRCTGGLSLKVKKLSECEIEVKASHTPKERKFAKHTKNMEVSKNLTCQKTFKRGQKIFPDGDLVRCAINGPGDVFVIVHTSAGPKSVTIRDKIGSATYYELSLGQGSKEQRVQCLNNDKELIEFDCEVHHNCNDPTAQLGFCANTVGIGKRVIDGVESKIFPDIYYGAIGKGGYVVNCELNGEPTAVKYNCNDLENDCNTPPIDYCAGLIYQQIEREYGFGQCGIKSST